MTISNHVGGNIKQAILEPCEETLGYIQYKGKNWTSNDT